MASLLINLDVPDLQAAVKFYTTAFALQIGRRLGERVVELVGSEAPIYLLQKSADDPWSPTAPASARSYERHWTPLHLDFVVEDLDAAVERACEAGARLEVEIRTHDWGRIAQLSDPFGHGLCILQFLGRGYDEIST